FLMIIIAALSDHRIQKREQKKTMIDLFNKKCYLSARINLLPMYPSVQGRGVFAFLPGPSYKCG
ncbi:MAG: hypothetical protein ABIE07_06325, partial [Candidatus Zixiibacteriota bacterium]